MLVFSGVRPTGDLQLGNYLGAVRHWVHMQNSPLYPNQENLFCVVDLHALTTERHNLFKGTQTIAAAYLASGINPKKSIIFVQSQIAEHTELCWILGCFTPLGWLNRMTQFKDKAGKQTDRACLGLYAYPVLQAADILLYKATHVPIGEDQKQHLELARDIATTFNRHVQKDIFLQPEPMILGETTRVMSLRDGTSKMSKSDLSDYSRINLMDSADLIVRKIRKAKTDPACLPSTLLALENRPEAKNLLAIYASLSNQTLKNVCLRFAGQSFSDLKKKLTDLLIEKIVPIGHEMRRLLTDGLYLDAVLEEGAYKAKNKARETMKTIKEALCLNKSLH